MGDKIRIVVQVNTTDGGSPRLHLISTSLTLEVDGLAASFTEFPLVHPTTTGNFDDFVDDDGKPNTGDLVYGYTIKASDRVTASGLSISTTKSVVNFPHLIEDQHVNSVSNGRVTLLASVVTALAAIRADGSRGASATCDR